MEISQVISNIQALCRKTIKNGCTEAEAISAANKIGELMKVYNLTMDRVFLNDTKCTTGIIPTGRIRRHPIDGCVVGIAEFCDCRCWFSGGDYKIFGLEHDVEMAQYLYSIVWNAMETATEEYKDSFNYQNKVGQYGKVSRKRLSVSFQRGMSSRIYHRLQEMKEKRHTEENTESSTFNGSGTSIVVVKRNKVEDEFEKLNLGLRKCAKIIRRLDGSAYGQGQHAGSKVNLNRPIKGNVVGYLS